MAAENYRAPSVAQSAELAEQQGVNGWDIAEKVRADLDRQSCPDAYMRIAVESVVKHLVATGKQQVGEVQGNARAALESAMPYLETLHSIVGGEARTSVWRCIERGRLALAARQPGAQEPVVVEAVATIKRDGDGELYVDWLTEGGIHDLPVGDVLLAANSAITNDEGYGEVYATPPAQGIDQGRFRNLADRIIQEGEDAGDAHTEADHRYFARELLTLIDGRDAAPGVGNGD